MEHVRVSFEIAREEQCELLIAMLAEAGYEGFEETGDRLLAYIGQVEYDAEELATIAKQLGAEYVIETIPEQNWNALWESNFEPVEVAGFCTVRADFHKLTVTTPYEIVITPKMSFGTGHHATTQLMIRLMKDIIPAGASVVDFGTGTGVLAILAEMLGAEKILAIDNDEWCVTNTQENIARNACKNITVQRASLEDIAAEEQDIILANINRHILLEHMPALCRMLKKGGTLLMSGLLTEDQQIISDTAVKAGLTYNSILEQSAWIAMVFKKI